MSFSTIDPIISRWASQHGLPLYTSCKDEETRAVQVTDKIGRTYGIGIDSSDERGRIKLRAYAWDFKRRHKEYLVMEPELSQCLEKALTALQVWMAE